MFPVPRCPVCGFDLSDAPKVELGEQFPCPRPSCGVQLEQGPAQLAVRTFALRNGYSLCVLPFEIANPHAFDAEGTLDRSPRWVRKRFSLDDEADVERTEYFLPYVRRFLFPSLFGLDNPGDAAPGRPTPTCRHYVFDLARLGALTEGGLPVQLECNDARKRIARRYDLLLEEARLIVFPYGIGFLVLRFTHVEPASYFDQMHALLFLRMIAPLYSGFEMPRLTVGEDRFGIVPLLGCLLAEFGRGRPPEQPAAELAATALPVKPAYDDRMMVYTFSCIDRETALEDPRRGQRLLYSESVVRFEDQPRGPRRDDEEEEGPGLKPWLRRRWQGFSKDGGSLVVFNVDRFHERFLGVYTGTYYFDIFLLAVMQRVTLLALFERLSDIPALTGGGRSRMLLRRVRKDLLLFKNQCWFSQITNRKRGLDLWKRWQETLENRVLLEEVNEQGEELDSYLQGRTRERVEWLVRLGGFLAAAFPAVLGVNVLLGEDRWVETLKWWLLLGLIIGSGLFAWLVFYRGRED